MRITREQWGRLRPLVQPALELSAEDVAAYLDSACGGDRALRGDVERLIRACRDADSSLDFLDSPAVELAAPLLQADASPEQTDPLQSETTVGPYVIERQIGRGGMGVVYLAHDTRLDRKVALKVLPPWLAAADAAKRRFAQEARAASRIDHPNIETVHEIDETPDGRLYIAMAYYEGDTLQARIAAGPLDVTAALDVAGQVAEGLGAAHAHDIVHRDIKPSNVILTADGVAKILDFGAAKIAGHQLTDHGVALGTVSYMSPEQTRREDVDSRSDVWSLGVVLYQMLTGRRPFAAQGAEAVIHAIRHDDPEPLTSARPDASDAVAATVARCLAKDPGGRYRDGAELAGVLRGLGAAGAGVAATPIRAPVRLRTSVRGRRIVAAAGLGLVLLVTAYGVVTRTGRGGGDGDVIPAAASIAVLPFTPVVDDSSLRRMGRELAVTLSATLDGVGEIRTAQALTVLAQVPEREAPSPGRGAEIARRLEARSYLHGTLVPLGNHVRVELELLDAADRRQLGRATVTGPRDDIGAVTDSATLAILHDIWRRGDAPAPNLSAVITRSLPALRAYLEGELAFTRAQYDDAVRAYERAYAADTTFLLAYWKSIQPRAYARSRPDSVRVASVLAHRDRLPEPERLMVDAYAAETLSDRFAALREVTRRFATHWPGWYMYADYLFHLGPYLGSSSDEARAAMDRVVTLNPDFAEAWRHLLQIMLLQSDSAGADRALAGLERFAAPDAFLYNPDNMAYFRALHGLLGGGGVFPDPVVAHLATVARRVSPWVPPQVIATEVLYFGFPSAQLQLSDQVLRTRPAPELAEAQRMGRAFAWAARGGWDSALVAADDWVRQSPEARSTVSRYGLAVFGVWAGAVPAGSALARRPDPTRSAALKSPDVAAELAWLDGILAYTQGDLTGIRKGRRMLRGTGSPDADFLAGSLEAFERDGSGRRSEAARGLAALEWGAAESDRFRALAANHPFLSAIHRLAAARWVLEQGDTLQALRLLPWHQALTGADAGGERAGVPLTAANAVAAPLALHEQARLEEARGMIQRAQRHYRDFLERYDHPPASHSGRIEQARAALARLTDSTSR